MTHQTFSTTFAVITLKLREKTDLSTFTIFKDYKLYDSLSTITHFTSKTIIKHTYIKKQRVVDSQRQFYMAKMTRAVAEVLHASCTHFFGVWRSQSQIVESITGWIPHIIQILRICYGFYTQFPKVERK